MNLEAALQEDAHLQHVLPQGLLVLHSSPLGVIFGRAVTSVCDYRVVLSPDGLKLPLEGSCLLIILWSWQKT